MAPHGAPTMATGVADSTSQFVPTLRLVVADRGIQCRAGSRLPHTRLWKHARIPFPARVGQLAVARAVTYVLGRKSPCRLGPCKVSQTICGKPVRSGHLWKLPTSRLSHGGPSAWTFSLEAQMVRSTTSIGAPGTGG